MFLSKLKVQIIRSKDTLEVLMIIDLEELKKEKETNSRNDWIS